MKLPNRYFPSNLIIPFHILIEISGTYLHLEHHPLILIDTLFDLYFH